eukprot:scaffold102697_cov69-Phaeocystis_antarctica.AAC.1
MTHTICPVLAPPRVLGPRASRATRASARPRPGLSRASRPGAQPRGLSPSTAAPSVRRAPSARGAVRARPARPGRPS